MQWASISETNPAAYLAWDEALLDAVEDGEFPSLLWFWESSTPFVVVGYGQKLDREVHLATCAERQIPALRRCSGGGAVVQGPGCLSYGLALRMDVAPELASIPSANAWIMGRMRNAIGAAVGPDSGKIQVRGYTDMAWGDRKFSGNAQRRRRLALLFHGTFLLNFDLQLIDQILQSPSAQPDYRLDRPHTDFVMNLPLSRECIEAAIRHEWAAENQTISLPVARRNQLLANRYSKAEFHGQR